MFFNYYYVLSITHLKSHWQPLLFHHKNFVINFIILKTSVLISALSMAFAFLVLMFFDCILSIHMAYRERKG